MILANEDVELLLDDGRSEVVLHPPHRLLRIGQHRISQVIVDGEMFFECSVRLEMVRK